MCGKTQIQSLVVLGKTFGFVMICQEPLKRECTKDRQDQYGACLSTVTLQHDSVNINNIIDSVESFLFLPGMNEIPM